MKCERCAELESLHFNRTEEFSSLVERHIDMFRNDETEAGRELDEAIVAAKTAMQESLRAWEEHRESHSTATAVQP